MQSGFADFSMSLRFLDFRLVYSHSMCLSPPLVAPKTLGDL